MIRVLHVVGGMNQGGTENFIMNLYRNIDKTKIQFDFLVNRDGVFDDEIRKLGGRIYKIDALQKVGQIKYTKMLREYFRNHKYLIVHSHINQVSGLILECAKMEKVPVRIAHSHGSKSDANLITKIYKNYLGKKILRNATRLLACSEDAAGYMFRHARKNAIIVENAVDITRFEYSRKKRDEIRSKFKIDDSTLVIGCIARFSESKNHLFLIDIFRTYSFKNNNSKLLLVGGGQLEEKIRKRVKSCGIQDKVIFAGTTFETEKYYSAFDCFVLPSLFEGLGIVLIEAQISGLKCLASKGVIPKEAKISNNLEFIGLDESSDVWTNHIVKSKNRKNLQIGTNYDIKKVAKKMESIYMDSIRGLE